MHASSKVLASGVDFAGLPIAVTTGCAVWRAEREILLVRACRKDAATPARAPFLKVLRWRR